MSELVYTPIEEIEKIRDTVRGGFSSGKLRSITYRKYQLAQLMYLLKDNMSSFELAFKKDLNRHSLESRFLELGATLSEVSTAYHNVEKWTKPTKTPLSFNFTAMRPLIRKEPKGTVLIIGPFNYPLWTTLGPVASALAAGNTVVLKPSESTPATSALLTELVPKYLDNELVRIVNGSVAETTKWDHIFFTGSGHVGKIVATAAAKHLTPISLELGGKSPVFIDSTCDLKTASKRILWGKMANAGQTCTAPDYILVQKDFQDEFIAVLKETYEEFFPDANKLITEPNEFTHIVTPQAMERVATLLENTKGSVVLGGQIDRSSKFIAPTVVKDVKTDDSLMSQEIFGPILPIVPVENVDEAIKYVNAHGHPLALYVFSKDEAFKNEIFNRTQSGAFSVNEVLIHPGVEGLPFGGTGQSGYGMHTGKYGFDTFVHLRSTIDSPSWVDYIINFRFPPYNDSKAAASSRFMPSLPPRPAGPPGKESTKWWGKWFLLALAFALAGRLTARLKTKAS